MILTRKAKEDFLEYYDNHSIKYLLSWTDFDDLPLVVKNVLIIEWFDSVGIYINTPPFYDKFLKYNRGFECIVINENKNIIYEIDSDNDVFNFRPQATEQAIKKANEIYNK